MTGAFLAQRYAEGRRCRRAPARRTKDTAQNVIFILLAGAPSHTDTFDLKMVNGVTPASFKPDDDQRHAVAHRAAAEAGAALTGDFAIVRSMRAHALVHSLAQTWIQIGRNPAAALGNIAPNIGSIVAIEKDKERKPGADLPDLPGAELQRRGGPGLPARELRAVQSDARRRRHREHHQSRRARRASTTASSCCTRWTTACGSIRPTARRWRTTTTSTMPRSG